MPACCRPAIANELIRLKARVSHVRIVLPGRNRENGAMNWMPISSAPFDRDLELAVINRDGEHALAFPCRRVLDGWTKKESTEILEVHPTHWRDWRVYDNA